MFRVADLIALPRFPMKHENLLMVADSERDANMLYAVRLFVADPFIFLRLRGRSLLVLPDPELDRARRVAKHCRVLAWSAYARKLQQAGGSPPTMAEVINRVLREHRLRKVHVPASFPLGLARALRRLKVKVKLREGNFFRDREFKSADELKKISAALTMAEVGLAEGIHALRNAKVGRTRRLLLHNAPLTSERLRAIIDTAVLQAGGIPAHTIVAGGRQACDPHESGHGPLRANEPIILDVFPRSQRTGYFGDITRTVVKGRASEAARRAYHTLRCAQDLAFARAQPGTQARAVHQTVSDFLEREGFATQRKHGRVQGFFHGTGHGIGLDLHECPRVSAQSTDVLQRGHVITIEPGLYYPSIGGLRLEDIAHVSAQGAQNLTQFEKNLEV